MLQEKYQEYRCYLGKHLLCRAKGKGQIEIVNRRNKAINYIGPSRGSQDIGLKGVDFQKLAIDIRCKNCGKLLAKTIGSELDIEVMCSGCKTLNTVNTAIKYNKFLDKNSTEIINIVKNLTF